MNKDIRDYLQYYIGQKVKIKLNKTSDIPFEDGIVELDGFLIDWISELKIIKLILRPLSEMTEEERKEFSELSYGRGEHQITISRAIETKFFLEKGFDIFNLHESGLCLYRNQEGKLY